MIGGEMMEFNLVSFAAGFFGTVLILIMMIIMLVKSDSIIPNSWLIVKAKNLRSRKREIYRGITQRLNREENEWVFKFEVDEEKAHWKDWKNNNTDYIRIRENEVSLIANDLVKDLIKRGYVVDRHPGTESTVNKVKNITLKVRVK